MHNGWDMFSDMESHFIPIDIFATCISWYLLEECPRNKIKYNSDLPGTHCAGN